MEYAEVVEYLYGLRRFGVKLGLEHIGRLVERLGRPERRFRSIHVGGTNGKGSVAAMIAAALAAAGHRVGLFTSPHISSFRERFRVNGEPISRADVVNLLARVRPIIEEFSRAGQAMPTFFEVITAMALDYFAAQGVEVTVLEVGMGGRFDATNVVEAPVCVITNVALEHTHYLGDTVEKIAFEKAGIIKAGAMAISGCREEPARSVVRSAAAERGATLLELGRDISWTNRIVQGLEQTVDITTARCFYPGVRIPLLGIHQADNASLALTALEAFAQGGKSIAADRWLEGLAQTKWPCRFEVVPGDPNVILDVAHNPAAAAALAATIKETIPQTCPLSLVLGILADKEVEPIARALVPRATDIIVTQPESERALPAGDLFRLVTPLAGARPVEAVPAIADALKTARDRGRGRRRYVLVAGSTFLMARARSALGLARVEDDVRLTERFRQGP